MPAKDIFYKAVETALIQDGWINIKPLKLDYDRTTLEIDLSSYDYGNLSNHADAPEINSQIQTVAVFDTNRDHYQLLRIGWTNSQQRIFNPILHIDIIEGKVWIQENRTDIDIGKELSDRGIPKCNIVLGLHPPHLRPYNPDYCVV